MPNIKRTTLEPEPKPLDEQIKGLSKDRRDWLEVFGSQFKPRRVMVGTCEACVFNQGVHSLECPKAVLYP